ncbi:MAG: FxsA family protein [Pirellulales bacterium]|nr:FxsA family protein [Pirellulales bacterium]
MLRLLILFTIVPLVELWLLISIGEVIGPFYTIAIILVTGVVGASLARWQGILCLQTVQRQIQAGQLPTDSLLDGLGILVAAALLITPGVLTDIVGFTLLIPSARRVVRRMLGHIIRTKIHRISTHGMGPNGSATSDYDHDRIIDVRIIDSGKDKK